MDLRRARDRRAAHRRSLYGDAPGARQAVVRTTPACPRPSRPCPARRALAAAWRPRLAGGDFSAGDLMMVTVLRRLHGSGLLREYPNVCAYVARGEARLA